MLETFTSLEFELPLISFLFIGIIAIIYFTKESAKSIENNYFEYIVILSLFYALINTALHFLCAIYPLDVLNEQYYDWINVTNKVLMILMVSVTANIFAYIMTVAYEKVRTNMKKFTFSLMVMVSIYSIIIIPMDVELIEIGTVTNATGPMLNVTYIFVGFFMLCSILATVLNFNKSDKRYYIACFIFAESLIMGLIAFLVPGIMIYDVILAILCFVMFHTIENPDLKSIQKLNAAAAAAEKANLAKSDFLSSMSHEIRTPLNAIVGLSADILDKKDLPDELKEDAHDISVASNTLLEIVGNIMDISKIESQLIEIVDVEYNPKNVINDIVKLNEFRIKDKNIKVTFEVSPRVPYKLFGDKAHVKQIANNFISNAYKYTEKGFVKIYLDAKVSDEKCILILSVEDSGIGIKKDHKGRLFNKFDRLDAEKNSTTEGTGLGLTITNQLVALLNGKLTFNSSYGHGSSFKVEIPQKVVELEEDVNLEETIKMKKIDMSNINFEDVRILIVDDNNLNIKVAKRALAPLNVITDECTSGEECLTKVRSGEKYDIILMDIMMPDLSGEETFVKLKEIETFDVPVIALTADAISGAKTKYIEDGFSDYIAKPFSKEQIKYSLEKVLHEKGEK